MAAFVRIQRGRGNVHAVRGYDNGDAAFIGVGKMDITRAGKKKSRGLRTYKIGVSFCKREMMGQLGLPRPADGDPFPPGFVHLPSDVTEDEVKQLTSEEEITHFVRGKTRREWTVIPGRRNEGLDCANYARGLAAMRGWDSWREAKFLDLEALLTIDNPTPGDGGSAPPPAKRFTRSGGTSSFMKR